MEKRENQTIVVVKVTESAGRAVNAAVFADLKWCWRNDPPLDDDDREWWSKDQIYAHDVAGSGNIKFKR